MKCIKKFRLWPEGRECYFVEEGTTGTYYCAHCEKEWKE